MYGLVLKKCTDCTDFIKKKLYGLYGLFFENCTDFFWKCTDFCTDVFKKVLATLDIGNYIHKESDSIDSVQSSLKSNPLLVTL